MKHQINNTNRDHTADYIYKTSYGTCILDQHSGNHLAYDTSYISEYQTDRHISGRKFRFYDFYRYYVIYSGCCRNDKIAKEFLWR